MPSNPYDAKGLLISSIESDDPIVFFEPKRIYNGPFDGDPEKPAVSWASHPKGEVPEGHYTVPIGEAEVIREGNELIPLPEGNQYPGYIFAHGRSYDEVLSALRTAHAHLKFVVAPLFTIERR